MTWCGESNSKTEYSCIEDDHDKKIKCTKCKRSVHLMCTDRVRSINCDDCFFIQRTTGDLFAYKCQKNFKRSSKIEKLLINTYEKL